MDLYCRLLPDTNILEYRNNIEHNTTVSDILKNIGATMGNNTVTMKPRIVSHEITDHGLELSQTEIMSGDTIDIEHIITEIKVFADADEYLDCFAIGDDVRLNKANRFQILRLMNKYPSLVTENNFSLVRSKTLDISQAIMDAVNFHVILSIWISTENNLRRVLNSPGMDYFSLNVHSSNKDSMYRMFSTSDKKAEYLIRNGIFNEISLLYEINHGSEHRASLMIPWISKLDKLINIQLKNPPFLKILAQHAPLETVHRDTVIEYLRKTKPVKYDPETVASLLAKMYGKRLKESMLIRITAQPVHVSRDILVAIFEHSHVPIYVKEILMKDYLMRDNGCCIDVLQAGVDSNVKVTIVSLHIRDKLYTYDMQSLLTT